MGVAPRFSCSRYTLCCSAYWVRMLDTALFPIVLLLLSFNNTCYVYQYVSVLHTLRARIPQRTQVSLAEFRVQFRAETLF